MRPFKKNEPVTSTRPSARTASRHARGGRAARFDPAAERAAKTRRLTMLKIGTMLVIPTCAIAAFVPFLINGANENKPDLVSFCYGEIEQRQAAMFIGHETIHFADQRHMRALKEAAVRRYDLPSTKPNTRISFFTNNRATTGDIATPELTVCKPSTTLAEHQYLMDQDDNIASLSLAQINANAKAAKARYVRKLNEFIEANESSARKYAKFDSPMYSQFRSLSSYYDDFGQNVDDLLIFTTGLVVSQDIQWCKTQNHLPTYANWKRRAEYPKLKPFDSVNGANVNLLLLNILEKYPQGPYCTKQEIYDHWTAYWSDHTGHAPTIHTLEYGHGIDEINLGAVGFREAFGLMLVGLYGGIIRSGEG